MSRRLAIVLAAGKGTRMQSDLPKVLFEVCGRPMIEFVLDALEEVGFDHIVPVVGYRADLVRSALANRRNLTFVEQTEQLGTGHAVMVCRNVLEGHDGLVAVLTGDSPLVQPDSLRRLLSEFDDGQPSCVLGTLHKDNPEGLGRIVRDADGRFTGIVEQRDATDEQKRLTEVNMSCYIFNCRDLLWALGQLRSDNAQREYYITDCPGLLLAAGKDVRALPVLKPIEALSINTRDELAAVEAALRSSGAAG